MMLSGCIEKQLLHVQPHWRTSVYSIRSDLVNEGKVPGSEEARVNIYGMVVG
jgi:hypothetical protein